jgi:four helix bundle protein
MMKLKQRGKGQGASARDDFPALGFLRATTTKKGDKAMNEENEANESQVPAEPAKPRYSSGTFENLEIWQEAITLATHVYEHSRKCEDFDFRCQIRSASVSISSNIAEGYERDSNAELIRFLFIAKGSCGEVRSQSHLAHRVGLLDKSAAYELINESQRLSRRIQKFIDVRRVKFN